MIIAAIVQYGFLLAITLLGVGALGSLLLFKKGNAANLWTNICAILASAAGIGFASFVLLTKQVVLQTLPLPFSFLPAYFPLRFDALSAFFVLIISVIALVASIYGIGYQKQFLGKYNLGFFGFFYNLFIASLLLTVSANHGVYFLIAWEIMSLTSYFLVIFEHQHKENIHAGFLYFIMSQAGTAFILVAMLLLFKYAGSLDFEYIRQNASLLSDAAKNFILAFALIGFGTKAGIIPLHIWLPEAHPAAPSHVSALMSGVLIKTAVFMIIRFFLEFFPGISIQWGLIILALGAISSLLGVLYALSEHDLKRLLAYHSVENIGIILLGVGSAIAFASVQTYAFAALALAAALFHTMNHAIFKALLFLSAGSVISKTHTRNIEEFGGLLKKMPFTGLFFLIGAAAISALPPLNGFASEWMTFQALFAGIGNMSMEAKSVFVLAIVALAFTGGLAAACFVKAFGVTFLARPRSKEAEHAKESGISLRIAMGILAVLCIALGLGAGYALPVLSWIAQQVIGYEASATSFSVTAISINGFATLSLPQIALGLGIALLAVFLFVFWISRKQRSVIYETWSCGAPLTPRMEITGTSFSRSVITIFKGILKPSKQTEIEYHDDKTRYFTKSKIVTIKLPDMYNQYLYDPISNGVFKLSRWSKKIQSGNINTYLLYIFLTLIGLFIWSVR